MGIKRSAVLNVVPSIRVRIYQMCLQAVSTVQGWQDPKSVQDDLWGNLRDVSKDLCVPRDLNIEKMLSSQGTSASYNPMLPRPGDNP